MIGLANPRRPHMATDPATIPADDPERHVRLCDIPDAIRELREAADMWRGRYALTLTQAGEWERKYLEARSTIVSQQQSIFELQRVVYHRAHDETAAEIKRLRGLLEDSRQREEQVRRDLVQTLSELDDAQDRADRNEAARHRLDAAMRLLDEIAREGLTECRHCIAGYRWRDLDLGPHDPMASREDLEGALRAYEDAYGDPPDGCDDPTCWRGWDISIEVPDVLRGEGR